MPTIPVDAVVVICLGGFALIAFIVYLCVGRAHASDEISDLYDFVFDLEEQLEDALARVGNLEEALEAKQD